MKGQTRNSLYQTWSNMISRCECPGASGYENYGARGIKVCERWRNSFDAFLSDLGPRPPSMSINRINNDGNYTPENCNWASKSEQARNTRKSRRVEIFGRTYHVAELEEITGVDMRTITYRIKQGWPIEKVLSKGRQYNNAESQKKAVQIHAEQKRAESMCKRGHKLEGENLYIHDGKRMCRTCRRAWDKFLYYGKQRPLEDFL